MRRRTVLKYLAGIGSWAIAGGLPKFGRADEKKWQRNMKILELGPGRHQVGTITEPTEIVGTGWDTIIEPAPGIDHTVNVRADVKIRKCQIRHAPLTNVKGQGVANIELELCWIHSAQCTGVYGNGDIFIRRCLIERNGTSGQWDHGVYHHGAGKVCRVDKSIVMENADCQIVTVQAPGATVEICDTFVLGRTGIRVRNEQISGVMNNTIGSLVGVQAFDKSNLIFTPTDWRADGYPVATNPGARLLWPCYKQIDGRGAYQRQEGMDANDLRAYAARIWLLGNMWPKNGGWTGAGYRLQRCLFPKEELPDPDSLAEDGEFWPNEILSSRRRK